MTRRTGKEGSKLCLRPPEVGRKAVDEDFDDEEEEEEEDVPSEEAAEGSSW